MAQKTKGTVAGAVVVLAAVFGLMAVKGGVDEKQDDRRTVTGVATWTPPRKAAGVHIDVLQNNGPLYSKDHQHDAFRKTWLAAKGDTFWMSVRITGLAPEGVNIACQLSVNGTVIAANYGLGGSGDEVHCEGKVP